MAERQTRYNIEVTDKDIVKAKRNNSYVCVVSTAIARTIPDATRIETDSQTIRFSRHGERLVFLTPYAVSGYVIGFDAGDPLRPFSFQLRNPIQVKRRPLTKRGAEGNRLQMRARRRVIAKAKASGLSPDRPEVKAKAREAAKAAWTAAADAYPGEKVAQSSDPSHRRVPRRVFKHKQRSYGHRLLRINQEPAAAAAE